MESAKCETASADAVFFRAKNTASYEAKYLCEQRRCLMYEKNERNRQTLLTRNVLARIGFC